MTRWQSVACMGAKARQVLASGDGRILAASASAAYLFSHRGQLIWLTTERAPMHRRGVQVAERLPLAVVGSTYTVDGSRLWSDGGLALDWAGAGSWHPPEAGHKNGRTLADLGQHLSNLSPFLDALPGARGFGVLLPSISGSGLDRPAPNTFPASSPAVAMALPSIQGVARACRGRDFSAALGHAEALAGLGEGLTPSGDDFVGGLLFGLVTMQAVHAPFREFSLTKLRLFLTRAEGRTNLISLTLLRDHAAGQGSELLHRLAGGLIDGQSGECLGQLALRLVEIGHTTGWDLLTGLWTGLQLVATGAAPYQDGVPEPRPAFSRGT